MTTMLCCYNCGEAVPDEAERNDLQDACGLVLVRCPACRHWLVEDMCDEVEDVEEGEVVNA